jgi:hypothetical protein
MTKGILVATALVATGCGSSGTFANKPRPPAPVDLTVYINNQRVSVSPDSLGAGPINFIVTNQANKAQSLQIEASGASGTPVVDTGTINPQATATVTVDLKQGEYTMTTGTGGSSQAQHASNTGIHPARLHIGPSRPSGKDLLLQP